MTKFTQLKKTPIAAATRSKSGPRLASANSSKSTVARKSVPADIRKGNGRLNGKIATIVGHLRRAKGASIDELMTATGWQAHSVRGAISGSIRKKQGLRVTSEKNGPVRLYRIVGKAAG
jgi:hypothetical protein